MAAWCSRRNLKVRGCTNIHVSTELIIKGARGEYKESINSQRPYRRVVLLPSHEGADTIEPKYVTLIGESDLVPNRSSLVTRLALDYTTGKRIDDPGAPSERDCIAKTNGKSCNLSWRPVPLDPAPVPLCHSHIRTLAWLRDFDGRDPKQTPLWDSNIISVQDVIDTWQREREYQRLNCGRIEINQAHIYRRCRQEYNDALSQQRSYRPTYLDDSHLESHAIEEGHLQYGEGVAIPLPVRRTGDDSDNDSDKALAGFGQSYDDASAMNTDVDFIARAIASHQHHGVHASEGLDTHYHPTHNPRYRTPAVPSHLSPGSQNHYRGNYPIPMQFRPQNPSEDFLNSGSYIPLSNQRHFPSPLSENSWQTNDFLQTPGHVSGYQQPGGSNFYCPPSTDYDLRNHRTLHLTNSLGTPETGYVAQIPSTYKTDLAMTDISEEAWEDSQRLSRYQQPAPSHSDSTMDHITDEEWDKAQSALAELQINSKLWDGT
ncbi:uncharacterized protein IL334_007847 [Kwoniella shivajii]|uniref:HNH nuclease domain-containing protein n=1 Tax=Kwoniella shivajii TaxID=564305 RepID=A0ABZ1DAA2_9TREE|nr:hypothetical protein IL334_007847 [Kwoniella shivajii]